MSISEMQRRILVVDDDESVLALAVTALRRAGYAVDATSDPRVALEWIWDRRREWDLLISDLDMPHFRGTEVVHVFKTYLPDAASIMFTGSHLEQEQCPPQARPDAVLRKPCAMAELIALVGLLQGRNQEASATGTADGDHGAQRAAA